MLAMAKQRVQIGVVVAVALVVAVLGAAGPTVSAQSVSDMEQRDRLIADQENLLNTYRCLFGVDVQAVPGGCPDPVVVSPGAAPEFPTQQDLDVRDGLIGRQEALLNVYRCRFDVDVEIVTGGCGEEAVSEPTPTADPGPTGSPAVVDGYSDVASDSSHFDGIDRLRREGVLAGTDCADGRFCPDLTVTGLAFATWLTRILDGQSAPDPIARLVELGVAEDCGDQRLGLCPDGPITRGQMAAFFVRAFDLDAPNVPARFVDVETGSVQHASISWLVATAIHPNCGNPGSADCSQNSDPFRKIASDLGCGFPSRFCPESAVSRGQMASLLGRAIDWQDARAAVAVTGVDDSIGLTVAYDEEAYEATVRWSAPPAGNGEVDHYVVQSRLILEDFGPRFYEIVEAETSKTGYQVTVSNSTNTNHLYAFRVIAVYASGKRLATNEVKTPSRVHRFRDVTWDFVVEPYQDEQPWLADTWLHMNDSARFGMGFGGGEVSLNNEYPHPNGLKRVFARSLTVSSTILRNQSTHYTAPLIEEMGHVYTLTNQVGKSSAHVGIGHLYVHLFEVKHSAGANKPTRCSSNELYGDMAKLVFYDRYSDFDARLGLVNSRGDGVTMSEWRSCGLRLDPSTKAAVDRDIPAIARSVLIDQEPPRWFYDTYQKPDGTIDLEKLWSDITIDERYKQTMGLIAHHLRNEFGGYCSQEQVRQFIEGKVTGITNPRSTRSWRFQRYSVDSAIPSSRASTATDRPPRIWSSTISRNSDEYENGIPAPPS